MSRKSAERCLVCSLVLAHASLAMGAAEVVLDMDSLRHRMGQVTMKGKGKKKSASLITAPAC